MGDIADDTIDGIFDYETGEYIGPPCGYPRTVRQGKRSKKIKDTSAEAEIRKIRTELAILIEEKLKSCTTKQQQNAAVEQARQEINLKYGKGWREKGMIYK